MKYIVYLTTNLVNNNIYVGVHKTIDINIFDGYLGCGVNRNNASSIKNPKEPFQYAVKKYGFDNFKRQIIQSFDTEEEALYLEGLIVNQEFIDRNDTYNIALGGGLPPRNDIKVYQYDLDGNFIKEWESYADAGREYSLNKTSTSVGSAIQRAVEYKHKSYNYLWAVYKVDKLNILDYCNTVQNTIVYLYDNDFKYIKTFNSINKCCKFLNVCLEQVRRAIKFQYLLNGKFYVSVNLYDELPKQINKRLEGSIHQYDLNGNYIATYKTLKEASEKTGLKLVNLTTYIRQKGYYKGYQWIKGDKLDFITPYINKSQAKKIGQYTMDGKLVKIFNTVREARKEFPNVSKVLTGKALHCHNYTFKYID